MPSVRCPVMVGRAAELAVLTTALDRARSGAGRTVSVVGPAGIGKSRLITELASIARRDIPVLTGRATDGGQAAFRPIAEALQAGLRAPDGSVPENGLDGFRPALARLLPQWQAPDRPIDTSSIALAEGVLRLLRALAADHGLLMVLEDLHWSDPDTLTVLEYLADNVTPSKVLIVTTARDDSPAGLAGGHELTEFHRLLHRLRLRDAATLVELRPLAPADAAHMATACLADHADRALVDLVSRRCGGLPLLVEELVAVSHDDPTGNLIPPTVSALVDTRLAALSGPTRACIDASAVLGERFDWELLAPVLDSDRAELLQALRASVRSGLLAVGPDGGFAFRHALIRDAVLHTLLPPERVELARRALHAVRTSQSKLSGAWCALAADLAVQGDDPAAAADLLLELGRRDLARGALASAEATLRRARALARTPPAPADTVLALDELLSEVLVQAGRPDDAAAVTTALLDGLIRTQAPPRRRAAAHLRMAQAWTVAGHWDAAATQADLATATDPATAPAVALIRAHIAIGRRHFDHAEHLARTVCDDPDSARSPDLACEAFEILGRLARRTSLNTAESYFTRVVQAAEKHNLLVWRARGLHELSTIDLFSSLRTDHARQASEDAAAAGASALTAVADYHLGSIHCWRGDYIRAMSLLRQAEQISRALKLPLLAMILIMQAEVNAQQGCSEAIDRLCAEALSHAPDDPHVAAAARNARATAYLMAEDHPNALAELTAAANDLQHAPLATTSAPPLGRWVLLATLYDHRDALPAVSITPGADVARWNVAHFAYASAIHLGRAGRRHDAEEAFRSADTAMTKPVPMPHLHHTARRLVAQAAIADGWGEPATWLHQDAQYFADLGHSAITKACRTMLRAAGGRIPRRTPGPTIPPHLRGYDITGREMQILQLIISGMTNNDIATHLVLSRRTVEKHIENIRRKTQTVSRADLAKRAQPNQRN